MRQRLLVAVVAAVIGCSGAHRANPTAPPKPLATCPREPEVTANAAIIYGNVVDERRHPLAGVAVDGSRWHYESGIWRPHPGSVHAVSDATGRYELRPSLGALRITASASGRTVVAAGLDVVDYVRHLDLVIDMTRPPGSVTAFDARVDQPTEPCAWVCPIDHVPVAEWWRRPHPCPDGATPEVKLDVEHGFTAVACRTSSGEANGAFSSWLPGSDDSGPWQVSTGWYLHGERCGMWREPGHDGSSTLSNSSAGVGGGDTAVHDRR